MDLAAVDLDKYFLQVSKMPDLNDIAALYDPASGSSYRRLISPSSNSNHYLDNTIYGQNNTSFNNNGFVNNLALNKEALLASRKTRRNIFTAELIQFVIEKYMDGYNIIRIKFNETTEVNSYKENVGHNYIEYAINHLQSKDFMCTIEELMNDEIYSHEYVINL